jgi:dTDP-glucose 4,6-dehydratase
MKRILVTGGAGFIGSNFVRHMLREHPEDQIFVLDDLTYAGNLANFEEETFRKRNFFFWKGSICDRPIVDQLVSQVDQIVHFAAETHVDNSIYNTDDFVDTDVKGTQILLDAVRRNPVERFIHISTSEVYGTAETTPMGEDHPLNPRSPYASAKCGADRIVYSFHITFDLPVVILRPFNNYGPRQHAEKLIPCFITRALRNRRLPMHGDGSSSRDWVYVEDCARAVERALLVDLAEVKGEVINIGTGRTTSVNDITRRLLRMLGKPESLVESGYDRPGQVYCHLSSVEKAQKLLGWKAEVSIEDGLERTVKWYRENESWWKALKTKHDEETW